jgi:hypothetical protein
VSLPWKIVLAAGEVIENVQWFFNGRSEEVVAMEMHGHFIPMPSFSTRVTKTTNAGIDVKHMQVAQPLLQNTPVIRNSLIRNKNIPPPPGLSYIRGVLYYSRLYFIFLQWGSSICTCPFSPLVSVMVLDIDIDEYVLHVLVYACMHAFFLYKGD